MTTLVVGVGQPLAGDDGVGHAVIERLGKAELPTGVELARVREASALLPIFERAVRVIVIDAVVAEGQIGDVLVLDASELDGAAMSSVSSHGLGVVQALALSRTLSPQSAPEVTFVGVIIAPPTSRGEGLSAPVERALDDMVARVLARLQES